MSQIEETSCLNNGFGDTSALNFISNVDRTTGIFQSHPNLSLPCDQVESAIRRESSDTYTNSNHQTNQTNGDSTPPADLLSLAKRLDLSDVSYERRQLQRINSGAVSCWPNLKWKKKHKDPSKPLKLPDDGYESINTINSSINCSSSEPTSETSPSSEEYDPSLVDWCITKIDGIEPKTQLKGIYRISGNAALIAKLEKEFEQGVPLADLESEERVIDLYSIADLLKRHFRSKSKPLLSSPGLQDQLISINSTLKTEAEKKMAFSEILHSFLVFGQFEICKKLFQHLNRVASYEDVTKMTASNLATFWAPNLFSTANPLDKLSSKKNSKSKSLSSPSLVAEATMDIQSKIQIIEFLIKHCEHIFQN